jgi:predicted nucleic acid-binding protein
MMYLDTSVMVKLLTFEPDSAFYAEKVEGQSLASCELLFTEVSSALLAKERGGKITPAQRRRAWSSFSDQVEEELIRLLPCRMETFRKAASIIEHCHPLIPLRTLDALHLASCDLGQVFPMLTNDSRMMAAAQRLGIPVL